jgi:beta-lactamase class A
MLDLRARQTVIDRLPVGFPEYATVAHKTANWENATQDVGIVFADDDVYVIAVMSEQAWIAEPIVVISELVYEYFAEQDLASEELNIGHHQDHSVNRIQSMESKTS